MRKCPVCGEVLVRLEYEGTMVQWCPECKGHLIDISTVERIKRTEHLSTEELLEQAEQSAKPNSEHTLKCPRCYIDMKKRTESFPDLEVMVDYCNGCKLIWLDGGELALLQLGYESDYKAFEARRMKETVEECEADPERQAEYLENKSHCIKDSFSIAGALAEGFAEGSRARTQSGFLSWIIKGICHR